MGAPVRSNIFRIGSKEQRYFSSFPVQVAILFSPSDHDFAQALSELFVELDRITGDHLVFFAVLDPPAEWKEIAGRRTWWQDYNERVEPIGFSFDERPLVREIASQFQVEWSELPALVVSTNLWTSEFFVAPTSPHHLESQLIQLTELVREWGQPSIAQMIEEMQDALGVDTRYVMPSDQRRFRLYKIYDTMSTYDPRRKTLDLKRYRVMLDRELRQIDFERPRVGNSPRYDQDSVEYANLGMYETFAGDSSSYLIAPATVAKQAFDWLNQRTDVPFVDELDEESLVMLESALTIGDLLEGLDETRDPRLRPLRFPRQGREDRGRGNASSMDFSPGAQGVWKAFEREINLSLIQAVRQARGILMPEFYTLYDKDFPKPQSRVMAGSRPKDVNVRDPRLAPQHQFFELGVAKWIVQTMLDDQNEQLDQILRHILGGQFPTDMFDGWETIRRIRNNGSHSCILPRQDYERILGLCLNAEMLTPLMQVKKTLRS